MRVSMVSLSICREPGLHPAKARARLCRPARRRDARHEVGCGCARDALDGLRASTVRAGAPAPVLTAVATRPTYERPAATRRRRARSWRRGWPSRLRSAARRPMAGTGPKSTRGRKNVATSAAAETTAPATNTRCSATANCMRSSGESAHRGGRRQPFAAGSGTAGNAARHDRAHRRHADRGADAARELVERGGDAEPRPLDAVLHRQQQRQHLAAHAGADHQARAEEQRLPESHVEPASGPTNPSVISTLPAIATIR